MVISMNGSHHDILLLAERLRVEERLLMTAFSGAGRTARILTSAEVSLTVGQAPHAGQTVVMRLPAGRQAATLALLLQDAGATVVNAPSLATLLEDRARLLHWLDGRGIATLPATVAFSEESALEAAGRIGYPVVISPLDAAQQSVIVHDQEMAEAVIEHRAVLGGERSLIVRRSEPGVELRRVVVAGDATFAATAAGDWPIRTETAWQPVDATENDRRLADALREALGHGIYHADCIAGSDLTVLEVRPLENFRIFHDAGYDVAGAIARHALTAGSGVARVTVG